MQEETYYDSLEEALFNSLLNEEDIEGIWVQKYSVCGDNKWDCSFLSSRKGLPLFSSLEIEGLKNIYNYLRDEDYRYLCEYYKKESIPSSVPRYFNHFDVDPFLILFIEEIERICLRRWNENHTIKVQYDPYMSEADMYGISDKDFFCFN